MAWGSLIVIGTHSLTEGLGYRRFRKRGSADSRFWKSWKKQTSGRGLYHCRWYCAAVFAEHTCPGSLYRRLEFAAGESADPDDGQTRWSRWTTRISTIHQQGRNSLLSPPSGRVSAAEAEVWRRFVSLPYPHRSPSTFVSWRLPTARFRFQAFTDQLLQNSVADII